MGKEHGRTTPLADSRLPQTIRGLRVRSMMMVLMSTLTRCASRPRQPTFFGRTDTLANDLMRDRSRRVLVMTGITVVVGG